MRKIIPVLISCYLLAGCVDARRISSYETLKSKFGIDEILQNDWAVLNSGDVYAMARKEIDLRLDYLDNYYAWYVNATGNGTHYMDKTLNGEYENRLNKANRYYRDIFGMACKDELNCFNEIMPKLWKMQADLKAIDDKIYEVAYDFSPLYKDGDAKNEIAVDLNNYLDSPDGTDWNTSKLTARAADILKRKGIYHSKAKGCWVVRKKINY